MNNSKKTNKAIFFVVAVFYLVFGVFSSSIHAQTPVTNTISVVTDDNYPPFVFKDSEGNVQGILIDQWRLWEKKTGIHVDIHAMDWNEALRRMRAGEFDVIDTLFQTDERKTWLDFSKAYRKIAVPIFFQKDITGIADLKSLQGFIVAAKAGDSDADLLKQSGLKDIRLFDSYKDIVEAAKARRINVFVVDEPSGLYFLNKMGIASDFRRSPPISEGEMHRAVKKGNSAMLKTVEDGFAQITPDEFTAIDKKWLGTPLSDSRILKFIELIALAVIALIVLLGFWNWSLNRQVQRRTEELLSNEEARQSEMHFSNSMIDSMPGIVYFYDENGKFLRWNHNFLAVSGYSAEEMKKVHPLDFFAGEEKKLVQERIAEVLTKRESSIEANFVTKSGVAIPYFFTGKRVIFEGKTCVVGVGIDISEQKKIQRELLWKSTFLAAQVESSLDGILVVENGSKKSLQNQKFIELFNIPKHIAETDDDAALLRFVTSKVKNPEQFAERVAELYARPDEVSNEEIELLDGKILERYSSPVRDKAGTYYGRIWTFRDLTERRKLESQFRQSQKMEAVGQLASGVAHDFNNILGIIQIQVDLLKAEGNLSPSQNGFASEIAIATQRCAALTRQLLLFSRKERIQMRELDLNQSINDMTKMLRRTLGVDIQLQFKFAMQPLFIHADAGMMDQTLMNLVVNARDAMAKGGKIVIETSAVEFDTSIKEQYSQARAGSFVCLSVSDTGCGIPRENLQRIFEPFFTTKEVGKGTGLGLATVFGIVQQHKGWINVYSEVGQGTIFRVYIPRLARISDQKFIAPTAELSKGGNETILLVEDEPSLRSSVKNLLSRLGYNVLEAQDGPSAIEAWKKHRNQIQLAKKVWDQDRDEIHLLLTDMVMPGGMTGKDLGEELLKENPRLKVLYVSGYSAEVAGGHFPLEEGMNFLTKPFQSQKLAQTIRNILDKNTPKPS